MAIAFCIYLLDIHIQYLFICRLIDAIFTYNIYNPYIFLHHCYRYKSSKRIIPAKLIFTRDKGLYFE